MRELGVCDEDSGAPYFGVYGACSTMAESLTLAAMLVDGGYSETACAVTGSHFCTAERQYRYPLEYGGQRTPISVDGDGRGRGHRRCAGTRAVYIARHDRQDS